MPPSRAISAERFSGAVSGQVEGDHFSAPRSTAALLYHRVGINLTSGGNL